MEETTKIRKRSEIPVEDTWATEDLYPSDAAWEQALATLEEDKNVLASYAGQLAQSCGLTLEKLVSVTEIAPQAQENALTVEAAVEVAYSVQ